jgi:hypothetical protein
MYVKRVGHSCGACNKSAANTKGNTLVEIGNKSIVLCPKCKNALRVALQMDEIRMPGLGD